nr:MAG TPA: hypothetical protein [Caudoviricetes sp.]
MTFFHFPRMPLSMARKGVPEPVWRYAATPLS